MYFVYCVYPRRPPYGNVIWQPGRASKESEVRKLDCKGRHCIQQEFLSESLTKDPISCFSHPIFWKEKVLSHHHTLFKYCLTLCRTSDKTNLGLLKHTRFYISYLTTPKTSFASGATKVLPTRENEWIEKHYSVWLLVEAIRSRLLY